MPDITTTVQTPAPTAPVPPVTPPTTPPEATKPEPKYTDDDLNARAAAARKEGAEKAWKKHGFDSEKAFDDYMAAKKTEDDARKTEAQKDKEAREAAEKRAQEVESSMASIRLENAALKAGVSPDKAERFVKLAAAYDGVDDAAKIAAALADFPEFKTADASKLPNVGGKSKSQPNDDVAAAKAAAAKAFGLKGTL